MVDRSRSISPPVLGLEVGKGFANRHLRLQRVEQNGALHWIPQGVPYQAMLPGTLVPHGSNKMPFLHSNSGESVVVRKAPRIRCQAGSVLRGLPGW